MTFVKRIRRLVKPMSHVDGSDPAWYDQGYRARPPAYMAHYTKSPYYVLWQSLAEQLLAFEAILEVGCGTGQFAEMLADMGIKSYTGFDFSAEGVAIARNRIDADFRVADAMTTDLFATVPYDAVVATKVLEHLPDDVGMLRRIRPGAHVFATVPSFDYPDHARYFRRTDDVQRRYAEALTDLSVKGLRRALDGAVFYVIHGIR